MNNIDVPNQQVASPEQSGQSGFLDKLKQGLAPYLSKINLQKFSSLSKRTKMLVVAGGVFVFSLLLMLITAVARSGRGPSPQQTIITQTPSPTPVVQATFKPSQYASDQKVVELKAKIDALVGEYDSTSLEEYNIYPPELDFDIEF